MRHREPAGDDFGEQLSLPIPNSGTASGGPAERTVWTPAAEVRVEAITQRRVPRFARWFLVVISGCQRVPLIKASGFPGS